MSILSAFNNLNHSLLESASTDEFKLLLTEIAEIEADIKTLEKEVSDGWTRDFAEKLNDARAEINKVHKDLRDIISTYETEYIFSYDEDGHPDYDYETDPVEKRKAEMLESAIRLKLAQVEAAYDTLKAQLEQEHALAFKTQKGSIQDKSTTRDAKKKRKEEVLRAIIEEERPELERLIKQIGEYTKATIDISKITFNNGKLYLAITSETDEIEIDLWDDIDYDDDYASVNIDKLESYAEDRALEDGFLFDVAFGLGIAEDMLDQIDFTFSNTGKTVDIPNSTWKLLTDCDLDSNEPSASVHYDEVEVDEDFEYTITCYLVKEI